MTVEKPKPQQLPRPITTGANSAMNQSQFLAIICNSLKSREESRVHGAIDFGLPSQWLKNWRQSFKPITKRSNRNHVITFDSHLKTALSITNCISFLLYTNVLHQTLIVLLRLGIFHSHGLSANSDDVSLIGHVTWTCVWCQHSISLFWRTKEENKLQC